MKRRPLSMKRLTIMAGHFTISLGMKRGTEIHPLMLDFLRYVWEHKDDDNLTFYPSKNPPIK